MGPEPRVAAIVAAAGRSSRMGRPKGLIDVGGVPLLRRVASALIEAGCRPVLVVVPPADRDESEALGGLAAGTGAEVVVPTGQPPEMRASVELALGRLDRDPPGGFLLAPLDAPGITARSARAVIAAWRDDPSAVHVPIGPDGRRGHPVALPWASAGAIRGLPADRGINAITRGELGGFAVRAVEVPDDVAADLDTPEQLRAWLQER